MGDEGTGFSLYFIKQNKDSNDSAMFFMHLEQNKTKSKKYLDKFFFGKWSLIKIGVKHSNLESNDALLLFFCLKLTKKMQKDDIVDQKCEVLKKRIVTLFCKFFEKISEMEEELRNGHQNNGFKREILATQ